MLENITRCKHCNKSIVSGESHDMHDCIAYLKGHEDIKALLRGFLDASDFDGVSPRFAVVRMSTLIDQIILAIEAMEGV